MSDCDVSQMEEWMAQPDLREPTQQQKCAELAKAMFPTAKIEDSSTGVDVRVYDKPNETRSWYNFDPYADHEACHALKLWLATDDARWSAFTLALFNELDAQKIRIEDNYSSRRMMTADPAIIAEAAWRSIQSTKQETT
jgi:hypothetical protein